MSAQQDKILQYLANRTNGASSIIKLVRDEVCPTLRRHAVYARVRRLKEQGMVSFVSEEQRWRVFITAKGLARLKRG